MKIMKNILDKRTINRIEGLVNIEALSTLKSSLQIIVSDMSYEGWDEEDIFDYLKFLTMNAINNIAEE